MTVAVLGGGRGFFKGAVKEIFYRNDSPDVYEFFGGWGVAG